jgi:uncharacterized lipoprotein YmbA
MTRLVLLALSLSLIACASSPPRYKAYRLEVNP